MCSWLLSFWCFPFELFICSWILVRENRFILDELWVWRVGHQAQFPLKWREIFVQQKYMEYRFYGICRFVQKIIFELCFIWFCMKFLFKCIFQEFRHYYFAQIFLLSSFIWEKSENENREPHTKRSGKALKNCWYYLKKKSFEYVLAENWKLL